MRMRRAVTIVAGLVILLGATAADCGGKGNVIEVKRYEENGFTYCDIVVRPDDQDSAPFKLEHQSRQRCNRCPVGARWPDCNSKE